MSGKAGWGGGVWVMSGAYVATAAVVWTTSKKKSSNRLVITAARLDLTCKYLSVGRATRDYQWPHISALEVILDVYRSLQWNRCFQG